MTASPEGFPPQDLRSFLELCAGDWLALRSHFDLALAAAEATDPQAQEAVAPANAAAADEAPFEAPTESLEPLQAANGEAAAPDGGEPPLDWAALLAQASAPSEPTPQEESWHRSERGELRVAFLEPHEAEQAGGLRITAPPGGAVQELQFRSDGTLVLAAASRAALEAGAEPGRWQLWPDGSLELSLAGPHWRLRERIWFTQPNLRLRSSVERGADGAPGRARFSSEIRRVRKPAA